MQGFCVAGFMAEFLIFEFCGGDGRWPMVGLRRLAHLHQNAGVVRDWVHGEILDF
jgi:hypothetical protein